MTQAAYVMKHQQSNGQGSQQYGRQGDTGKHLLGAGSIDKVCRIHFGTPETVEHGVGGKGKRHQQRCNGIVPSEDFAYRDFAKETRQEHHYKRYRQKVAGSDRVEREPMPQNCQPVACRHPRTIGEVKQHEEYLLRDENEEQGHIKSDKEKYAFCHIKTITEKRLFYCPRGKNNAVDNFFYKKSVCLK